MEKPIVVGAVLYNPKVSVIWDIIGAFFQDNGCAIDTVFYTNYELQVEALLKSHIDIAWNSPLAWLDAQRQSGGMCRAIAMRDTDRDRVSYLITKPRAASQPWRTCAARRSLSAPKTRLRPRLFHWASCNVTVCNPAETCRYDALT